MDPATAFTVELQAGFFDPDRFVNPDTGERSAYSAYAVLCVSMVWQLHQWNLLGLRMLG